MNLPFTLFYFSPSTTYHFNKLKALLIFIFYFLRICVKNYVYIDSLIISFWLNDMTLMKLNPYCPPWPKTTNFMSMTKVKL